MLVVCKCGGGQFARKPAKGGLSCSSVAITARLQCLYSVLMFKTYKICTSRGGFTLIVTEEPLLCDAWVSYIHHSGMEGCATHTHTHTCTQTHTHHPQPHKHKCLQPETRTNVSANTHSKQSPSPIHET